MKDNNAEKCQSLIFTIAVSDTIYRETQCIPILLKVENITPGVVSIVNPSHWANAMPFVKYNGKEIPLIKIKINPEHLKDRIQIKGGEAYIVHFDYTLDQMVNLHSLPSGLYEIYFRLQGETLIESNVYKFYKK